MNDVPAIRSDRLTERLKAVGLTERKASLLATGKPDTLRFMRTRGTMPSFSRMFAIAQVLKATPKYLFGQTDVNEFEKNEQTIIDATLFTDRAVAERRPGTRQIPVLSSNSLTGPINNGDAGPVDVTLTNIKGGVVGFVAAPSNAEIDSLLAVYVADPAMHPLFDSNVPVVFDLYSDVKTGDYALIFISGAINGKELRGTSFMLRRVVDQADEWITVEQLHPLVKMQIPRDIAKKMARVLTMRDYVMPTSKA